MKETNYPQFVSETYREAGYSDEIIADLKNLESQDVSVESILSKYRYIQPDGELFSERSLRIIFTLNRMEWVLEAQKDLICDTEQMLEVLISLICEEAADFLPDEGSF